MNFENAGKHIDKGVATIRPAVATSLSWTAKMVEKLAKKVAPKTKALVNVSININK